MGLGRGGGTVCFGTAVSNGLDVYHTDDTRMHMDHLCNTVTDKRKQARALASDRRILRIKIRQHLM